MDEREKIIREDYPVDRLPEDLRAELGGVTRARLTVEPIESDADAFAERRRKAWEKIDAHIERMRSAPGFKPIAPGEAVARIRELRDEWER